MNENNYQSPSVKVVQVSGTQLLCASTKGTERFTDSGWEEEI